jgi:hypothetical protein
MSSCDNFGTATLTLPSLIRSTGVDAFEGICLGEGGLSSRSGVLSCDGTLNGLNVGDVNVLAVGDLTDFGEKDSTKIGEATGLPRSMMLDELATGVLSFDSEFGLSGGAPRSERPL